MKIALLTNGIFPYVIGGIQKHSYYLAKGFAQKKIYVDVYHLKTEVKVVLKDYFTDDELVFIKFHENEFPRPPKHPGHYILGNYIHSKNLYQQISKSNYDFIYAQGFTAWYFLKKEPFKANLVSCLHGLEMYQNQIDVKNRLRSKLLQIPAQTIIKSSKIQISLGGKLTQILIERGAKKEAVIELPNGIDSKWIIQDYLVSKRQSEAITFTFVGRNERRKGIVEIAEVLKKLSSKKFHFNFVGLTSSEVAFSGDNINFHGIIRKEKEIMNILNQTDVLVCPSYSEGMPTVILEAMARGCAILASDVGAVSEMVDETNGWLIKKDILKELEEGIKFFMDCSPDKLHTMKLSSIHKVKQNFTWDKVIETTLKEIQRKIKC